MVAYRAIAETCKPRLDVDSQPDGRLLRERSQDA
jgi:hypothetical protein